MKGAVAMGEGYLVAVVMSPGAWIAAVLGLVIRAITPSVELGAAVVGLVLLWALDFALGIVAAWVRGESITSEKMGRGFAKLMVYLGILTCLALLKIVAGEAQWQFWQVGQWVAVGACSGREATSILQKASVIGVKLPPGLLRFLKGRFAALGEPEEEDGKN